MAALAGCGANSDDDSDGGDGNDQPTATTRTTTTTTTTRQSTEPTTTPDGSLEAPYEDTLGDDHPMVKWTPDTSLLEKYDYIGLEYVSMSALDQHIQKFADGVRPQYRDYAEALKDDYALSPDQIAHSIEFPSNSETRLYFGEFTRQEVIDRHQERGSIDEGTRDGYRVFKRSTPELQYPKLYAINDGELLVVGGHGDHLTKDALYRLLDSIMAAGNGNAARLLDENRLARLAHAPFADIHWLSSGVYTPEEAREEDGGVGDGLRYFPTGFRWEGDRVYIQSTLVYEAGFRPSLEAMRDAVSTDTRFTPYDTKVSVKGQVAYITGAAPIEKWDDFEPGPPPSEPPENDEDDEYIPTPRNTQWSFETDYSNDATTVTYEFGPDIERIDLVGVTLNNGTIYETQFRTEYEAPLEPGASITIETPPSQAGKYVTISWLSDRAYVVLDDHQLPEPDKN